MRARGEGDSVLIRPKGNADHPGRDCHVKKGKVTAHSEGLGERGENHTLEITSPQKGPPW